MAKLRTGALRQLHADLGKILADYDASRLEDGTELPVQPEAQDDNPRNPGAPSFGGNGVRGAQDGAPTLAKPKGLTAYKPTAASRALNEIPGYSRLRTNRPLPK